MQPNSTKRHHHASSVKTILLFKMLRVPLRYLRFLLFKILPQLMPLTTKLILFGCVAASLVLSRQSCADSPLPPTFTTTYCTSCHDSTTKSGNLDLTSLTYTPTDPDNLARWVKIHDRLQAGEMPPTGEDRPNAAELNTLVTKIAASINSYEAEQTAIAGRAKLRRLNGYEYENALRDLLSAPWLQVRGQFPEDGEAFRYNKIGTALDVSHVHMSRYMSAADYAIRQILSVKYEQPPTSTKRYYARNQRTLTRTFTQNPFNSSPDRQTYPLLGFDPEPEVRRLKEPLTVGDSDPAKRELEAIGWVSSNYVTGFTYRWDQFRAPVAGRYRFRFSGYTMWCSPGGTSHSFSGSEDRVGKPRPPNKNTPNYDEISRGRTTEPITVYTRNGVMNRRVGEFDLNPEPGEYDIGEVWLLANETLVPDASRFYRSRPSGFVNPLMTPEGCPSVAFRWMEVEGPLYDDATTAGYQLLFGDLPLRKVEDGKTVGIAIPYIRPGDRREGGRNAGTRVEPVEDLFVEVISTNPRSDAGRLLQNFLQNAYRSPIDSDEAKPFLALFDSRIAAGLSFTESMLAAYTAVLASPKFVYLDEQPGRLDDHALATRLSLFLWNSTPDARLRDLAARGQLSQPETLRAETERLLADPKSRRFVDAFLDYWVDLRKIEDSTPSTTLYNDYYLDDALVEAAVAETQLFFADLLTRDLPAKNLIDSNYTFLNERLANHYDIDGVQGIAMRRVELPKDSPRGGLLTHASVLKVTANGTTTSPVLRGKWIMERILGFEIPQPPAVPAVEPDIRGAVTIRQQLEKHRADQSCAVCHNIIDPPGFALESFDVMGGWRDRYRGVDEDKPAEPGRGKNGHPFVFHYGLPVDSAGTLPNGQSFTNIRNFKRLLLQSQQETVARNLTKQLLTYSTGAPLRFSDREQLESILKTTQPTEYGLRSLIHSVVMSELFRNK
jgi:hypothetical protein